jgi:hypothetical protein
LDLIYTGRIVPGEIAGSSIDQSNIPHPNARVQEEQRIIINAAGRTPQKRLLFVIAPEAIVV